MIEEVAEQIWARDQFQDELRRLLRRSIQEYVRIEEGLDELDDRLLLRLIQSATHFAATSEADKKEIAYRIASCSWNIFQEPYEDSLRSLMHVIFGRLGNFPAVKHLFQGIVDSGNESARGMLPGNGLGNPVWLEVNARQIENEINVSPEVILTLTDFQRQLWNAIKTGQSISVNAPTSAGKSFAMQNFLGSQLDSQKDFLGLYIVPTRSLIHQVSRALKTIGREVTGRDVNVLSIPQSPSEAGIKSGIYVLTQERLQILLEAAPSIQFSMAIVDEAQTIGSGSRGIILQTAIDHLREINPQTQFIFSTPTVANPEVFGSLFGLTEAEHIDEIESPVAQNLIFLNVDETIRDLVNVEAQIRAQQEALGQVKVGIDMLALPQTLATLSWHFGREDQNLVYVGSQAASEEVASMIQQHIEEHAVEVDTAIQEELEELAEFLREHVHPDYLLADTVLRRVGFHYGQMPSIVRQSIEDFFDEGLLKFLVSTSTLLHGVNLPAKNLFILDPTKDGEWPLKAADAISGPEFWNLAGRAGRLGREFEGNVFIINQDKWRANPVSERRTQTVTSALDEHVKDKRKELIDFIADSDHASGIKQGLESTFVRLVNEARRGTIVSTLARIYGDDQTAIREVKKAVESVLPKITVPLEITERHITVSVYRQQEMYVYLQKKVKSNKNGPAEYIPAHPLAEWNVAYPNLLRLLKRVHNQFQHLPQADKSHMFFAGLALRWMRGDPLPVLIKSAYNYKEKNQKSAPKIATVIRGMMASIESDLRFRYVKYLGCYIDILSQVLKENGHEKFIQSIPAIPLFLELGASTPTMASLIGLGLSRTTASILAEKAANLGMNQAQAADWLFKQNLEGMGISGICIREVDRLCKKK